MDACSSPKIQAYGGYTLEADTLEADLTELLGYNTYIDLKIKDKEDFAAENAHQLPTGGMFYAIKGTLDKSARGTDGGMVLEKRQNFDIQMTANPTMECSKSPTSKGRPA